jgi:NAD(P)-dependent dehydrogenase (short-subunit alcohol dehydrogenase family)
MRLQGKTSIVTGAGSGIGRAIAETFAREGARVITVGRSAAALEKARQAAGELAKRLQPRPADVSDRAAVRELVGEVERDLGKIDILVNNAGINVPRRALRELAAEDFDSMVEINLTGAFNMIQAVLPGMRARGDGLIINVSSTAGVRAATVAGAGYAASKYGLSALSLSIGLEEGENGIRACLICPGEVNTPILDRRPAVPSPEQRARMLQPEDVAQAALLAATLHPRATIPQLIITPAIQKFS